ncbi:GntR family transcriptional regulator [Pedobacter frigoris]|uniref:GntR family transcriptional regulator n=1 Tax=Pedobacter frigoris TaxID=2571272 RepID=A0A4U1CAC9_9SPHI|nr:GntR family transcriptional regulator [Pedobacter frigoris]TKC02855.1 GntR family transcriptional regulator [Pedobacter frigoris]
MEFREKEAIYLQIAAYVGEQITLDKWPVEEKIPSVRDLAVELQVNPNTVVRAYEFLQNRFVISNKRGIGFFVETDAKKKIREYNKERFLSQDLPEFFKSIYLLDIDIDNIATLYRQYVGDNYRSK